MRSAFVMARGQNSRAGAEMFSVITRSPLSFSPERRDRAGTSEICILTGEGTPRPTGAVALLQPRVMFSREERFVRVISL